MIMKMKMSAIQFIKINFVHTARSLNLKLALQTFHMSRFIPVEEQDKLSSYSFKSDISNLQFNSPLPLPRNAQKIPTNDQIGQSYETLQQEFPYLDTDQTVGLLYSNTIVPKIAEQRSSTYSQLSKLEVKSRHSSISNASSIKPALLPFKVHPNDTIKMNSMSGEDIKYQQNAIKKKRRGKKMEDQHQMNPEIKRPLASKGENQENLRKAQTWDEQDKEHHFRSNEVRTNFSTRDEEIKFEEKRLVARGFCERGSGLDKLKEFLWQTDKEVLQMEKKRYQGISFAFMSESYRQLQKFLIEDCKRSIKPLISPQMRALVPILLKSQIKFEQDEYLALRKFVKVTFDLGSVSIFQQMAVKLYIRAQLCLRGRIGKMRLERHYQHQTRMGREMLRSPGRFLNQRLENQSIWTRELQHQLIDIIQEEHTIAKTRDRLKKKYGNNPTLNNVKELKARFFRILRIASKRLMKYAADYAGKVPLLVPLGDEKVKVLIRHPSAIDARFSLVRLYKVNGFNKEVLSDAINRVNQFCFLQQTRREQQEQPQQPVISSITDKIKHNIKVTRKLLNNVTPPAQRMGSEGEMLFLKQNDDNYQHIVSLQHNDKLHYFRKTGQLNNKGGFEYNEKTLELKKLQMQDGDDDSEQLIYLSDDDCQSNDQELVSHSDL